MNWNNINTNNWNNYKTQIRSQFNKLTDDDLNNIRENFRERLVERMMNRYGYSKEDAQQKLDTFITNLKAPEKV